MKIEIWKDILGYEGLYQISNLGRVKSLNYQGIKGRAEILTHSKHRGGYLMIKLCKCGNKKAVTIHRLVATAFIPNSDNLPCVCHRDDNPKNNNADNLFWGTQQDNMKDKRNKGRTTKPWLGKFGKDNPNSKAVIQYSLSGSYVAEYESTCDANRTTGVYQSGIVRCCTGKLNYAGGFKWKYKS